MSTRHSVSVLCVMHSTEPGHSSQADQIMAARMRTAGETMRALAAKKGRVIVTPTLRYEEQRVPGQAVVAVVARAQTAPRPGWRKPRRGGAAP